MKDFKDQIFIFDLHNTLYDEVTEYGLSMHAALDYLLSELKSQHIEVTYDDLCKEVARGHEELGSDWDDDVWRGLPSLQNLESRDQIIDAVIAKRREKSRELTLSGAYGDTIEAVRELKSQQGARLFLATEATANAAAQAVRWLGLDGVFDAVYSWPFSKAYDILGQSVQKDFPADPVNQGTSLQKPHPYILAAIIFDIARDDGIFPQDMTFEDVMGVEEQNLEGIAELKEMLASNPSPQAEAALKAIKAKLCFKDTPYRWALEPYFEHSYYIGDSYFKDGFLAQGAGISFIHAAYGKQIEDQAAYDRASEVMFKVTGWNPFLLKLTQEAGRLPSFTDQISPKFICKNSLREFLES